MADKDQLFNGDQRDDQFEAELPLPLEDQPKVVKETGDHPNPAINLIRQKLESAYSNEPPVAAEEKAAESGKFKSSKHQKFLAELAESGKPIRQMQQEWHEYYAGLPEHEKQQVWTEFESSHQKKSHYKKEQGAARTTQEHPAAYRAKSAGQTSRLRELAKAAGHQTKLTISGARQVSGRDGLRSLAFGLASGLIVVVVLLFGFFNERFIAPLVQPSRTAIAADLISGAVSSSPELIIPKINLEVPVVYGVTATDTASDQKALQSGVLHYADTALPGQDGNLVIVGHSSNNILNPGQYKFAFVLLHKLVTGDTFYLDYHGKRYVYEVYKRVIVPPTDTSVLGLEDQPATASLITCDPPGTSTNRLVVVGKQISPAVSSNQKLSSHNTQAVASSPIIPGNSPSLWSRLVGWLGH